MFTADIFGDFRSTLANSLGQVRSGLPPRQEDVGDQLLAVLHGVGGERFGEGGDVSHAQILLCDGVEVKRKWLNLGGLFTPFNADQKWSMITCFRIDYRLALGANLRAAYHLRF